MGHQTKRQRKEKKIMISDCCGVEIVFDISDLEMCPCCWEHCDVVFDEESDD